MEPDGRENSKVGWVKVKPIFFMMVGLPGSGKSYQAEKLSKEYDANIHSSDVIRKELFGSESSQEDNNEVFNVLSERIKTNLRNGKNAIHDATNIDYKRRKAFVESLNKIDCWKICVFIATPFKTCVERNNGRDRVVPQYVMDRMYKHIYIPQNYEGWDDIIIKGDYDPKDFDINELFNGENGLNSISQDNPHHTLTIGKHCLQCAVNTEALLGDDFNFALCQAALFHDIGKRFTKGFTNSKGDQSDQAHYYQHHLVSAYDSLFYIDTDDNTKLKIANYIQWHMQPFFMESDKARNKYKMLWGEQFYNDIMILHKADETAK